jgi:hypothetical protein
MNLKSMIKEPDHKSHDGGKKIKYTQLFHQIIKLNPEGFKIGEVRDEKVRIVKYG